MDEKQSTQRRGIMAAGDYAITQLTGVKQGLISSLGTKKSEISWALGGIIFTLSAQLLKIAQEVIEQAPTKESPNARDDIEQIRTKFNEFIDRMVNHE